MRTALMLFLTFALGWFVDQATIRAEEGQNWKSPAKWAVVAGIELIAVLIWPTIFPNFP